MQRPKNLKIGDKFRVIEGDEDFKLGEIISLKSDDGDDCPLFWNADKSDYNYIDFSDLEPYTKTTKPKGGKDKMKNKQKDYTSQAIFAIVAYLVVFTFCTLVAISSLWTAII